MGKKVLIISYTFPPFPGIGGRRWAKFSRYLAANGHMVNIICAKNPFTEVSQWNKDIENTGILVHYLPLNYPKILLNTPKNFPAKILYHLWRLFLSLYSKGTIFERSIFWRKVLEKNLKNLIKKNKIDNIIVTIPPYRISFYASVLKRAFPTINFIVDFRDPWTHNKTFHGFKNISASRLDYEKQMEQEVLNTADHVFTVSDKMTEQLRETSKFPDKISTLLNGFDPSDIILDSKVNVNKKGLEKIKFIYAGTLYNNLEYIIIPLIHYFKKLKKINIKLYNSLSFEFYGNHNTEIVNSINHSNSSFISTYRELPLNEIHKKIKNADWGVLMSTPDHSFAFNTKFYEYIANAKPILLFSNPGATSEFLMKNKLGFHINPNNLEKDMNYFLTNINAIVNELNNKFDVTPYSIPNLTIELERWLI